MQLSFAVSFLLSLLVCNCLLMLPVRVRFAFFGRCGAATQSFRLHLLILIAIRWHKILLVFASQNFRLQREGGVCLQWEGGFCFRCCLQVSVSACNQVSV
ncbi:hypothetical protein [Methanimicrococcus hongohii]|uniref:hypothetical protein n=1 Tax=Methanimicrococcus hongohii TaxID=3028295 RepID=UPI00292E1B26|nr:hypothetical protein [Methanimicrococcus sp. Hf6]